MTTLKALLALASGALALASPLTGPQTKSKAISLVAENEIYKFGWSTPKEKLVTYYEGSKKSAKKIASKYYIYKDSLTFVKDDTLEPQGDLEILYLPYLEDKKGFLTLQVTVTTPESQPPINSSEIGDCIKETADKSNILICSKTIALDYSSDFEMVVTSSASERTEWNFMVSYTDGFFPIVESIFSFPFTDTLQYLSGTGEMSAYTSKKEETCENLPKSNMLYDFGDDVVIGELQVNPDSPCYNKDELSAHYEDSNVIVHRGHVYA